MSILELIFILTSAVCYSIYIIKDFIKTYEKDDPYRDYGVDILIGNVGSMVMLIGLTIYFYSRDVSFFKILFNVITGNE